MSKYGTHHSRRAPKQQLLKGNSLQRELYKFLNIPYRNESIHKPGKRDFSRLARFAKGTKVRLFFLAPKSHIYHGKIGIVNVQKSKGLVRRYVEMSSGECFGENAAGSILFLTDKEYIVHQVMES